MPPTKLVTVERFRQQVRDSLRNTQEWARFVEAKPDKLDVPRLLKLLSDRSGEAHGGRDYFSERISMLFAESHDVDVLSRALALAKGNPEASILQRGFGTAKGRDYLLVKVTDEKETMSARLRYAKALHEAGEVYRSTLINIKSNSCNIVGEADEGNSGYLTRIAKAICATSKHEKICGDLIDCLAWFGRGIVQNKPAPMMADLRAP